jgi:deoxyadenosine/deoxycytidine kinase
MKPFKQKRIICIEGNVSSGKSTVIENLRRMGYAVFEEPLKTWQTRYVDCEGRNILELFYIDMKKWSFPFEVVVMNSRFKQLEQALECDDDLVFIERSLLTDPMVFAKNLKQIGKMDELEWLIYKDWHDTFVRAIQSLVRPHIFEYLYISTPPEECYRRKVGRARHEEDTVAPAYFHELHAHHEEWLGTVEGGPRTVAGVNGDAHPVHIIHGGKSREEVIGQIIDILGSKQLIKRFVELSASK